MHARTHSACTALCAAANPSVVTIKLSSTDECDRCPTALASSSSQLVSHKLALEHTMACQSWSKLYCALAAESTAGVLLDVGICLWKLVSIVAVNDLWVTAQGAEA